MLLKINGNVFYSLDKFLDLESFDNLHENITFNLAKYNEYVWPSQTSQTGLFDQNHTIISKAFDEHRKLEKYSELNDLKLRTYLKLNKAVTLGLSFQITGNKSYPDEYHFKHRSAFCRDYPWTKEFKPVIDWIKDQNCFDDFGRIILWINEPNQKTTYHKDYPNQFKNREKPYFRRDPFIWLTGNPGKKLSVIDSDTNKEYESDSRAVVFDTNNYHCSIGHPYFTTYSLRIDGKFSESFLHKTGLYEHFKDFE